MHRRTFIALAGGMCVCPSVTAAQGGKTYRLGLGFLIGKTMANPAETAFLTGLRDHGYSIGRSLAVDVRYADGNAGRLPAIADELIALTPDVLAGFESMAQAMQAKTTTIPIVLTSSSNPVGSGLAQSLGRPGGNVTGISSQYDDIPPKTIEILREILPRLSRIAYVLDPGWSGTSGIEASGQVAARRIGATLVSYRISNRDQVAAAFADMGKTRPDALLIGGGGVLGNLIGLIVENCQRLKIPFPWIPGASNETTAAALFLFGPNWIQGYRDSARYVDRILKGAKPGELPIEQPTRFELIINQKVARAHGLKVPQSVLVRADRVIE